LNHLKEEKTMPDSIGNTAGKIWEYLDNNGATSVTKITKETEVSKNEAQRAIGWLAKEGKLNFTMEGRTELLSLK
jgi:predicted HTH transcriptional regulator